VRLGAFLLRTEPELALAGRRCIPDRLVERNFKFVYTNLESALADLLAAGKERGADMKGGRREAKGEGRAAESRLKAGGVAAAVGGGRV
jgi:hypothetical protein